MPSASLTNMLIHSHHYMLVDMFSPLIKGGKLRHREIKLGPELCQSDLIGGPLVKQSVIGLVMLTLKLVPRNHLR